MSSALAAASLILKPEGYSEGTLESLKPIDRSGDFTFTRGSNLSATRINSAGLIEKGRENLLLQSNQFDTTWLTANTSLTGGQSGYDGSSDAWLLDIVSGTNSQRIEQSISQSGVQTYSVYVKKGTLNWVRIRVNATVTAQSYFDLENGVVGTIQAGLISRSIESVGNGWFRCSIVFNSTSSLVRIYPANDDGSVTQSSGNIYIQDAQLEIGLVATEPILSGATTGLAGILEDSPRFDYSGGASCPSLLLEPSRTNLLQSEYFEDSKLGTVTLTTNAITSPEGVQNASLVVCPSGRLGENVSLTSGTDYVVSVFAKQKGNTFNMRAADGTNPSVEFNLATQTTTDTNGAVGSMEDYGNGWYRCIMKFTASATGSFEIRYVLITDADGVYAYGAQVEQGSYPTSYIPNHSGGSVTRDADVCEGAGTSSTFNADEGVFYAEISTNTDDTDKAISLNNAVSGSLNNRLWMGYSTSNKRIYALGYVNNSLQFALSKLMTDESLFVKIACRYKINDIAFFVNGVKVGTDTTALNFTELNSLDFNIGTAVSGASPLYGNVKQVLVFNSYLSDSEIITLTS
jgi:hypothetical protein